MPGAFESFWESRATATATSRLSRRSRRAHRAWVAHLLAMDWENPEHRPILEMEGLRRWVPPRTRGLRDPVRGGPGAEDLASRW